MGSRSVSDPRRVVYDCNIFTQALMNPLGPAGACVVAAIENRVTLFVSEFVLEEIRDIPNKPTPRSVGVTHQKAGERNGDARSCAGVVYSIRRIPVSSPVCLIVVTRLMSRLPAQCRRACCLKRRSRGTPRRR